MRLMPWFTLLGLVSTPLWTQTPPLPSEEAAVKIRWTEAADHYDQECLVYGKVVRTKRIEKWCFLNFDPDFRNTFTVAIPQRCLDKFPEPPEEAYADQDIAVLGTIVEYKGKPEIVLCDPQHITVGATFPDEAQEPQKTPPPKPRVFDGSCTVASYNVLNLFDDQDDPYHNDESTPPKPREQLEQVAATIRRLDADVLALQEVENRGYLQRFIDTMLPDLGYEHVVLHEGNDLRGIDVAVLSRLPVGPVTSYRHLEFKDGKGQPMSFQRDLLRAHIEPPGTPAFDVFVAHLKSKRGKDTEDSLAVRLGEAGQIRRIFDDLLDADPQARFVLCGDFNDTPDSEPVKTLIGHGRGMLGCFVEDLPPDGRVSYNKEPHRSLIDLILASPAMTTCYRKGSYRIIPGGVSTSGSDHNPVVAVFDLK